jgi:hypothetical protein
MNHFMSVKLLIGGVIIALLAEVETASAQFVPRRGFRGGYYDYDACIYPDINQTNAAYQQAYTQEREYQAQSSMARTAAWQNINQSVAQQANLQTQSMLAQRQATQDWWFQTQAQQVANRQARASYQPTSLPKSDSAESYDPALQAPPQKPAAKEIMLWPTLLKSSPFDTLRAEVESPFRRAYVDNKPLTADDYRGILRSLDAMKAKLKEMSSQVVESEYAAVENYLNELSADAQKRLEARLSPKRASDTENTSATKP